METSINKPIVPYRIWLSLTGFCNNNCLWCYRNGSEISQFLDTNFAIESVKSLATCGTKKCTIIGGEPTLHKDYKLIIKELTESTIISCTFVTNGRLLSGNIPNEWSENKKIHIVISLHGANEKHYLSNAGNRKGFSETIQAIKNVVSRKVNHSVNVVISKENLLYMDEFVRIVSALKANLLCFTIAMPSMDEFNYSTDPFELAESVSKIHSLCDELNQKHVFIFSLPWCILNERLLSDLVKNKQLIFNCPIGKGRGVVLKENGSLTICTHLSSFGILSREKTKNIFLNPDNFVRFWNSPEIKHLRQTIDVYRSPKCLKCKYRLYCKSGCPLWWKNFDFSKIITRGNY